MKRLKGAESGQVPRRLGAKILIQAITKEKEAYNMYAYLAKVVKDAAAKELINKMIEEESKHVSQLERLGTLYLSDAEVKKIKNINPPLIGADFNENTTLQGVIDVAAKREQWAYEFYSSMAKFVDKKETKRLFNNLANEELKHKHEIEEYYNTIIVKRRD